MSRTCMCCGHVVRADDDGGFCLGCGTHREAEQDEGETALRVAVQGRRDARFTASELASMATLEVDPVKGERKTGGSRRVWFDPSTRAVIVEVMNSKGAWRTADSYTAEVPS